MNRWIRNIIFTFVVVAIMSFANQAKSWAIGSIDIWANYAFTDTDGDKFRETLSFSSPFVPNSGWIIGFDPSDDGIFNDGGFETVEIADLKLNPTSYSANYFDFDPTSYDEGFKIIDDDGSILLQADLTVNKLEILNNAGLINSAFLVNLTTITTPDYDYGEGSDIIDGFITAGAGAMNITLQASNLSGQIINSDGDPYSYFENSYSGSAAAAASVPEPTTMLLLGISLAGLAVRGVRRRISKNTVVSGS